MFHAPDADFQAASPLGKIPAIEDGGFKLADSSAILWYLERKHPTPAMVPSDPQALGRAVWFDKFGDTELFAKLVVPFVERILKPNMMGKPTDDAAVAKALNDDLPPLFDCLEREISGPYLVGDAFSIADISVATGFYNFHLADAQGRCRTLAQARGLHRRDAGAPVLQDRAGRQEGAEPDRRRLQCRRRIEPTVWSWLCASARSSSLAAAQFFS